jgi:transcriptional regulator with XRE-family HTH domain
MPQKKSYQIKIVPDEIHKKLLYIGQLVKQTRLAYGLRQIDFAKQQGISKNSLQNLEYGKNVTLLTLLTIINEIYSPREFFEDIE